jgi:hypothetical protein
MKLPLTLICTLTLMANAIGTSSVALAQAHGGASKEIGYQIGTGYYIGDLNPDTPLGSRFHLAQGGFYRHNFNSRVGLRFQIMNGVVEAWDEDSDNAWAQNRNLHFRNKITEFSVSGEINYIDHVLGDPRNRLTGYLTAGMAYFNHDPEGMDSFGNWHPLQPLGTEGQGWIEGVEHYTLSGFALPFGMGFKVNLGPAMSFQMEWGMRKTWTDYLDDVSTSYVNESNLRQERGELSAELADRIILLPTGLDSSEGLQRGDPGRNDKYGYFLASISFRVSKKPTTCWEQ